jgi:hypothetical protein
MEGELNAEVAHELKFLDEPSRHHTNLRLGGAEEIEEAARIEHLEALYLRHVDKRSRLIGEVIDRRK